MKILEIWVDIKGYERIYQISNKGRVRSLDRVASDNRNKLKGKVMRNQIGKSYYYIGLTKHAKRKAFYIHRLVCASFHPNVFNKPQINHINGIKTDNRVENLEWNTQIENMRHAVDTGLMQVKGEGAALSKLKNDDVINIYKKVTSRYHTSKEKQTIAEEYGVTRSTINKIIHNKTWTHITSTIES